MSIATVVVSGNLVAAPEVKPGKDKPYVVGRVAVNLSQDHANFYSLVAFGRQGDFLAQGQKGSRVTVTGDLKIETFTRGDGTEGYDPKIFVNRVDVHTDRRELEEVAAGSGDGKFDPSQYE